ncbi:MAG: transpeptidase family protein [Treponema sp.]|jgi:cell division protein FtsI (penicillin-binding protein 3)|nr:transpeptidase family protein [Treponema sp.]
MYGIDDTDAYANGKNAYLIRFLYYIVMFGLFMLGVIVRYGIMMLDPSLNREASAYIRAASTERGAIVDRNGRLLAVETKLGTVSLLKSAISVLNIQTNERELDMDLCRAISETLSPILSMTPSEIMTIIRATPSDYVMLKRNLDETVTNRLKAAKAGVLYESEYTRINAMYRANKTARDKAVEDAEKAAFENRKYLDHIRIDIVAGRVYPEKNLASQIIGMVGRDNDGKEGIEWSFESDLAATSAQSGKRLTLSIDVNIQYFLEQIARDTLIEHEAQSVMLTAMDPHTGEILGSASLPDFDPNDYNAYPGAAWRYQPALYAYEPGSVFKLFSVAALLDTGAITENSTFVCAGRYSLVNPAITDLATHGTVNAERIIALSCNVGLSLATDRIENTAFYNKIREFGFGRRIGSGSPSETAGIFNEENSRRFKPALAMGQGISVSMLHMLQAVSAIANKGLMVQPKLAIKLTAPDGTETPYPDPPVAPRRVISERTAASLLRYMRATAEVDGTGWRAAIGDMPMAVKTGTAQVAEPGGYSETDFIASCMAIVPADDPKLILYVVIVKPQGDSYLGGRIATIPVRKAAESLADYLKLYRGKNPVEQQSSIVYFDAEPPVPALGDVMPDLRGYSKLSLIPLFEMDSGFIIQLEGNGHVKTQTPPPGSQLVHGDTITLYLE